MQAIHQRSRRRGFTLIELIVVIFILAILAALIMPRIIGRTEDAKNAKATSDISVMKQAIRLYRVDTGRYPTTEEGLQALRTDPGDVDNWRGPYLEEDIPNDPWNNPYVYQYPGDEGDDSYVILSYGSDGQPGGEGNAQDIQ